MTDQRYTVRTSGRKTTFPGDTVYGSAATLPTPFTFDFAHVVGAVYNEMSDEVNRTGDSAQSNIGRIRFRISGIHDGMTNEQLPTADPLIPYTGMFPLVGEYVMIFKSTNRDISNYYYIGPVGVDRKVTENRRNVPPEPSVGDNLNKTQRLLAGGVIKSLDKFKNAIDGKFVSNNARPLKQFEGDVLFQGRYGQSIRFGSSQLSQTSFGDQDPNIILRAGQGSKAKTESGPAGLTNESVNFDASSIWMVSNQILPLIPATINSPIHMRSAVPTTPVFAGASILMNSDKLIFNAKAGPVYTFAKGGIHLNSTDIVTIDSAGSIFLRTPSMIDINGDANVSIGSGKDLLINVKKDILMSTGRYFTILADDIYLGGSSPLSSPIVLARPLKFFLYELLLVLMSTNPLTLGMTGIVNPVLIVRILLVYTKYLVLPDPVQPLFAALDVFAQQANELTYKNMVPARMQNALADIAETAVEATNPTNAQKVQQKFMEKIVGPNQMRKL